MITTTYTCDRCKKILEKEEQLHELKLVWRNQRHYSYSSGKRQEFDINLPKQEWCENCMIEIGFKAKPTEEPKVTLPTLEEFLVQWIRDEVSEQISKDRN